MKFIEQYWIYGLGFFAQSLFGVRLIVQLFHSEKKGKVVSPTVFWQISLVASFMFLIYGVLRDDVIIVFGQTLSYFIYIRNLQLKKEWNKINISIRLFLFSLPGLTLCWILLGSKHNIIEISARNDFSHPVLLFGAIGQLLLNFRFVYQWYYSEKHQTSILPLGFWIISFMASVQILIYAFHRVDPVLLVAQGTGIFVYVRNIFIHAKSRESV